MSLDLLRGGTARVWALALPGVATSRQQMFDTPSQNRLRTTRQNAVCIKIFGHAEKDQKNIRITTMVTLLLCAV